MTDVVEISASELAWMLTDAVNTSFTIEQGIPEGTQIIDAWYFDGVVYLRCDRELEGD